MNSCTSPTVPIDVTSMNDSCTIKPAICTALTVLIDFVNETDTVKDINIIPPINFRVNPGYERLVEVIKQFVTCPITMLKYSNPVRCIDE